MKPKDKAIELVNKYYCQIIDTIKFKKSVSLNEAKVFAIIAIDEIIATDMLIDEEVYVNTVSYVGFWEQVKREISLL